MYSLFAYREMNLQMMILLMKILLTQVKFASVKLVKLTDFFNFDQLIVLRHQIII